MMTISQIKMFAKRQLKGNLMAAIGAMILIFLCTMLWSTITSMAIVMGMILPLRGRIPLPGFVDSRELKLLYFVILGIIIAALLFVAVYLFIGLMLGNRLMYLNISRGRKVSAFDVFKGFRRGAHLKNYISVFLILYFIELIMTIPETYVALKWGYRSSDYRITSFITSILVFVVMLFLSLSLYASADNPRMRPMDALKVSAHIMRNRKMKLLCLELSFCLWIVLCFITCGLAVFWVVPYYETSLTIFYLSAYGEDYQNRIKGARYREVRKTEASTEGDNTSEYGESQEMDESEPKDTYVKGEDASEPETDVNKEEESKRSFEEVRSRYTDVTGEGDVSVKEGISGDTEQNSSGKEDTTAGNDGISAGSESSESSEGNAEKLKSEEAAGDGDASDISSSGESELKTRYSTEDDAFAAYEKWKKDHGITIDNPDPFHGKYKKS